MWGVKVIEKNSSHELMDLLGLEETLDGIAKANGILRYVHFLRNNNDVHVLRNNNDELRKA